MKVQLTLHMKYRSPLAGRYDAQPALRMYCHTLGVDHNASLAYDKSHERRRNQAHTRGRGNHSHA